MNRWYLHIVTILIISCAPKQENSEPGKVQIGGKTMGTIAWTITYYDDEERDFTKQIDSIFEILNNSLSTYVEGSTINKFNAYLPDNEPEWIRIDYPFAKVMASSQQVTRHTNGAFNPTVMPLVNYWGFFDKENRRDSIDSNEIANMLALVIDHTSVPIYAPDNNYSFYRCFKYTNLKEVVNYTLDFSAIAKGYFVDRAAEWLERKGIENYFIDIGGEQKAKGEKPGGKHWVTGIRVPDGNELSYGERIVLRSAVATSGNYEQAYEVDGRKVVHTINPKTGYPEVNDLLSVSVFAHDCIFADAYATAFMVMGYDSASAFVRAEPALEAYFIYGDSLGNIRTSYTEGLEEFILDREQE